MAAISRNIKQLRRSFVRYAIKFGKWCQAVVEAPFRLGYFLWTTAIRWVATWWRSRKWRRLLWSIPCLTVMGASAYFFTVDFLAVSGSLSRKYVEAGNASLRKQEWKPATMYFEKAYELGVRDKRTMFNLALAADNNGDQARKIAVLEILAPPDRNVFAPAHLLRATELLSETPLTEDNLKTAIEQLKRVVAIEPGNEAAHAVLGDIYFQQGFLEGAVQHLGKAGSNIAKYQLLHARACALTNRRSQAEAGGLRAKALSLQAIGDDPANLIARLELGDALLFLEEFEESLRILNEGRSKDSENHELRQAAAKVYLTWANSVLSTTKDQGVARKLAYQLVAAGMQQNPDDPEVFDLMMQLVETNDEASREAKEFLLDNVSTGQAVGISHLLLGTYFQEAGEEAKAGFHLEQAFKLVPEAPIVANNLAWHLAHQKNPESDRAMKLIQAVIDRFPKVPAYIDTRAHVFLRQGQWRKAADDFQISMGSFASEPSVHEGLAEAYANLEMTELAERHQKIAEYLRTQKARALPAGKNPRDFE